MVAVPFLLLALALPALGAAPHAGSGAAASPLGSAVPADHGGSGCGGSGGDQVPADGGGGSGPCGTWAWGAAANLTASLEFEGSYNASQFLTGGGLTAQGAYIDLQASLSAQWAAYAIINATSPAPGSTYVTFQAGQLVDLDLSVVADGTFPQAGTYGPSSNVTLVPMNVSLVAHLKLVDRYQAFLNLTTDANGSVALTDEHLQFFRTVDVSLNAVNFPNITTDPSGNAVVQYETGSLQAHGQVAADVQGTFTPALLLVDAPLFVGKSWTSSTSAQFTGQELWSITASGVAPNGQPFSFQQNGQQSANGNGELVLTFTVVGERTIYFPDGGSETDYVIGIQGGGGGQGAILYNGLIVVPTSVASSTGGAGNSVSAHPAATALSSSTATPNRPLYSPQKKMTDASDATPVSGQTVTAAPMSPQKAQTLLDSLGGLSPLHFGAVSDTAFTLLLAGGAVVVVGIAFREVRRRRRNRSW
ncbi:MAG: hypothetical protein KGJ23_04690 [Euryarchaeota archaeon]|nr:hypothetical protein [Euryarchaeota archaeon]MDE1835896.1 hypothetical protein [Euryarchaeota archaeon]MDE1880229.1 hypothetical protein [Euryarchaeota archaeon]MDE2044426.1 hypothetical protein [Thermoplasmata archaeon]